jgi:putative PEP-CTERM system TPR-repeat lipoprotein
MSPSQSRFKWHSTAAFFAAPLLFAAPGWLGGAGFSATAFAATNDPTTAQKHEAEADQLIAKDDLKTAEIELKNAVKADPENGRLRLKLANVEIQNNDIEGAQVELKAAREHGGDESQIIPLLGRTYLVQGKFDQLLDDLPVNNDAPANVRVATLVTRAEAQIQLKHIEDARSSLIAAEQIDPASLQPKLGLARIAFTLGQYDDAIKKADELLRLKPTADAHLIKGEALARKGDAAGAIAQYDEAIKADPNNLGGYIERAQLFIAQGEDAKAQADIKTALNIVPRSVPAQYFEALLMARAKDYAGADTALTKYATAFPAFPRGYYLQAVVKLQLKQYEQAQTAIGSYLAAVPNDVGGERVQAEILLRKGDPAAAAEVLEKVTADAPEDAHALAMLGEAYMQLHRSQQAIDAFDRASKLAPKDATVLRGLALNRLSVGQTAQGTSELEQALQLAPDDSTTGVALALDYIRERKLDEAAKLVDDMRKRDPKDVVAANMSGMVALARGHLADAETAYSAVEKQFPDYLPTKLQLAAIYSAEGQREKARAEYEAVIAKNPVNISALQNLSSMDVADNHLDQAVDLWQKAHRREEDNVPVAIGLIQGYIAKKDFDGGLSIVRDMQIRLPNEPRLFAMRAELELQKGAPAAAIVSLQRLTELQPLDPAARRDLAIAQEKAGDLSAAIATIGEARKIDPSNIGLAAEEIRLLGQRNPDDGVAAAQRLATQMPDQPAAQALEGDYLLSLKRPGESRAAYERAFHAHPSLVLAERIAASDVRDGKQAAAYKTLADWSAAHPKDTPAKYAVANLALEQKDWPTAKTQYEALDKEFPDNPMVLNNLAVIYQREDNVGRAIELAEKAHNSLPQNAAITDTLGWALFNKDKSPVALEYLRQAHDAAPSDLDIQYHLAYALNLSGKKADAADLLKKAVAAGREFDSKKDAQALLDQLSKS